MRTLQVAGVVGLIIGLARLSAAGPGGEAETGYQPEVGVRSATRLDWAFAAGGPEPEAPRLEYSYDSAGQRYQLFVPPGYKASRSWPLVIFISPGDDPLGWRSWRKPCEGNDVLFCAAYGAGNNCPRARRVRIVLDMLDDVRRRYHIDSDRTYLAGFAGGARLACAVAFALPEYVGGVIAVGGGSPLNRLAYLRHRAQDRLSVALVAGEADFNRRESEVLLFPLLKDQGIRSRLWVVPGLGHALPPAAVLSEVHAWLEDDLARRRAEARARPGLAAPAEAVTDRRLARRVLETAEAELRQREHTYRGVALLEGILARWPRTEAAEKAQELLGEVRGDARRRRLLAEQTGADQRRTLTAEAQAFEGFGRRTGALRAWEALARSQAGTEAGGRAAATVRRLTTALGRTPYLGLAFEGESTTVASAVVRGPAARAGLRQGDVVVRLGDARVEALADLRRALLAHKPGDKLAVEVQREGRRLTITVEVGTPLRADEE